jgi:hypothetical protein
MADHNHKRDENAILVTLGSSSAGPVMMVNCMLLVRLRRMVQCFPPYARTFSYQTVFG